MLDGMFSFVLLDSRDNSFLVARDAIGITSLYIGWGLDGIASFSSIAVKANPYIEYLIILCKSVSLFRLRLHLDII